MAISKKLMDELKALGVGMLYFFAWFGFFSIIMDLVLAEYQISPGGISKILIGALVLAKVVLILELLSLGNWEHTAPAWVVVFGRTALYAFGVIVVMVLEMAFEGRHEYGGFFAAISGLFKDANLHHILANAICATGALVGYNVLTIIRHHLGPGGALAFIQGSDRESA